MPMGAGAPSQAKTDSSDTSTRAPIEGAKCNDSCDNLCFYFDNDLQDWTPVASPSTETGSIWKVNEASVTKDTGHHKLVMQIDNQSSKLPHHNSPATSEVSSQVESSCSSVHKRVLNIPANNVESNTSVHRAEPIIVSQFSPSVSTRHTLITLELCVRLIAQ